MVWQRFSTLMIFPEKIQIHWFVALVKATAHNCQWLGWLSSRLVFVLCSCALRTHYCLGWYTTVQHSSSSTDSPNAPNSFNKIYLITFYDPVLISACAAHMEESPWNTSFFKFWSFFTDARIGRLFWVDFGSYLHWTRRQRFRGRVWPGLPVISIISSPIEWNDGKSSIQVVVPKFGQNCKISSFSKPQN